MSTAIRLSSIFILISCSALLSVSQKEMNEKLDEIQLKNDITVTSQNAVFEDIRHGMKAANMNIEAGNSVLAKVSEALKLDWIRQLGSDLKGKIQNVMIINFAIYQAVVRLQNTLSNYVDRGMSEELVFLEDPLGRPASFSLQFITSWQAFHSVLECRFQDMPGQTKMRKRQYALQASGTERDIKLSLPWQAALRPGQQYHMSFIFNQDDASESSSTSCPGCHTQPKCSSNAEIACTNCLIRFRRITVIQDDELSLGLVTPNIRYRKEGPYANSEHEEEDITDFKRVRIVCKRKRAGKRETISRGKDIPKPERPPTRPTQGDWVLIREMDLSRPDIAQKSSEIALTSDSDSETDL